MGQDTVGWIPETVPSNGKPARFGLAWNNWWAVAGVVELFGGMEEGLNSHLGYRKGGKGKRRSKNQL